MSRVSSRSARGLRPTAVMVAAIAACAFQSAGAQTTAPVLPSGASAVHGTAGIGTTGTTMTVTTGNGVGTRHSVINWQGFSIGSGARVDFLQPSVDSTSINRVVTNTPSSLLGTLTSNGRLVLVNPAGITVGGSAVIDTAAFMASTLGLSQANAIAGKLLFERDPNGNAALQVDGHITTHSGDLVLVGPRVATGATAQLQANGGSAILAAGESVEITGPGLEGIVMTVKAGNEAINLGSVSGDAVGIFAASLTHSGVVQANAVETADGRVVLKALAGNASVDGTVEAFATPARNGGIEVSGDSILGQGSYSAHGGAVTLTAGTGALQFGGIDSDGASSGVAGGTVSLTAQGDVAGFGITASGADGFEAGAQGGSVTVVSKAGNIKLGGVAVDGGDAEAGNGGAGGSIRLGALGTGPGAGTITLGDTSGIFTGLLSARGGYGEDAFTEGGLLAGNGGNGGSIVVDAARSVVIGTRFQAPTLTTLSTLPRFSEGLNGLVDASGGDAWSSGTGGNGGSVSLAAGSGDIAMPGVGQVTVQGGWARQAGNGGSIRMQAGGSLALGVVLASGGIGTQGGPDAVGGSGGSVSLAAGRDITASLLDAAGMGIMAPPRLAAARALAAGTLPGGGTAGAGGSIALVAGGDITAGGIIASGGGGAFDYFSLPEVGGAGGHVDITAGGKVTLTTESDGYPLFGILADGGSGVAQGGDAGAISVKAGGALTVQAPDPDNIDPLGGVRAVGGDGAVGGKGGAVALEADAFSLPFVQAAGGVGASGAGGAGGSVALTRTAGALVFDDAVVLDARGGGGVAAGGAGGSILLAARDGAVRLRSPTLFAAGGQGAEGGANGAPGVFSASGRSVEVEGDLLLDAGWNNGSVVHLAAGSVASLAGPFDNLAGATLAGTGTLRVAGGTGTIRNAGTIAPGGDGTLGTLALEGSLDMQAGSTLAVDVASAASADQLRVSGTATLDPRSGVLVKYTPAAVLAPGDRVAVLQAGRLVAATPPQVTEAAGSARPAGVGGLAAVPSGTSLLLAAVAPPPVQDEGQLARTEVREVFNLTADFIQGFERLAEQGRPPKRRGRDAGQDDIVLTDNACKP